MKLNNGWNFRVVSKPENVTFPKNFDPAIWRAATVPGTIHTDLLNAGIINDPFYSDNELALDWIHQCDWEYELHFNCEPVNLSKEQILLFEGLDTIAEISLNGESLDVTENMFILHRYNVTKLLKENNKLNIVFRSAKNYGKKIESEMGKLPVALDSERVYVRKAQYSFGWDWGPSFPTAGIWKNVFLLERNAAEVTNVQFETVALSEKTADLVLQFNLEGDSGKIKKLVFSLSSVNTEFEEEIENLNEYEFIRSITLDNPKLWYPNGSGNANLYSLKIIAYDNDNQVIVNYEKKVGIRMVELIQQSENGESTFFFKINEKKIFAKGVNWIPADSFLPRVDHSKYEKLLTLAKDANVNMVRVWGGGIYENDEFYDLCDRLGLLVWQDFMFACAAYPEYHEFINNVVEEVKQNVSRLRHHPSIVLWCGNNENEWIWTQNESTPIDQMPGFKIYHNIIPKLLKELDSSRPYWPSSPFGNHHEPNSFDEGNTHQWNIWSMWKDYSEVIHDQSKFVSEFGFQGPANIDTFEKYLPETNRNIQDPIFEFHNKQIEGPERLTRFLSGHLPIVTEFRDYLYLTQLNQGLALKTCIEHWRSNNTTNGSIIWQLNDCWPVTSWAIIDSEETPKLSYHFVKNIFSDVVLLFTNAETELNLIVKNENCMRFVGELNFKVFDQKTSELIENFDQNINLDSRKSQMIKNEILGRVQFDKNLVLIITIFDEHSNMVNRNYYINSRWKHSSLQVPNISSDFSKTADNNIIVESDKIALFVDPYHPDIVFNERGFILLPGEKKEVCFEKSKNTKFEKEKLKIRTLNQYLQ